jgi:hypothetical protein
MTGEVKGESIGLAGRFKTVFVPDHAEPHRGVS